MTTTLSPLDPMLFSPYNPANIEIEEADIISILTEYGLPGQVNNIELYKRAFIHRSYTKRPSSENVKNNVNLVDCPIDCIPLASKSNERLEFLGDCLKRFHPEHHQPLPLKLPKCHLAILV